MVSIPLYFYSPTRHESKSQVCVSTFQTLGFSPRTFYIFKFDKFKGVKCAPNIKEVNNISDKIFRDVD